MPLPLEKLCPDYDVRMAVFRAVDAPIAALTVAELCQRAGITRKRFYNLFGDKDGVFRWYLDLCFTASLYEIGRSFTWREGVCACLSYIADVAVIFDAVERDRTAAPSRFWSMNQARKEQMRITLGQRGIAPNRQLELEMELYSTNVPFLIRNWVGCHGEVSVDEYADYWVDCVPQALREALSPEG
mgnify:CR=1 FL=1